MEKLCSGCGLVKPTNEFAKRAASPDGYQLKCKKCNKEDNARFRNNNPTYKKNWDKKHPGVQVEITKKWIKANPEKYKAILRKYLSKSGSGVYRINNLLENKSYIGSSTILFHRLKVHFKVNKHKKASNKLLQDDMLRLGVEWFSFEILEYCDENIIKEREQYWIDTLNPEYNSINAKRK